MFYTVFSTNVSAYMQWQADLLEHSWKRVGQPGALIRLVATNDPQNLPRQRHALCVPTSLWDTHPETGDWYPIYNKPASLLEWLYRDQPDGTVLFVDPDCVFRSPVLQQAVPGRPLSQRWVNMPLRTPSNLNPFGLPEAFAFLNDYCVRTDVAIDPVMIPTLIHTSDLKRICGRWLELCGVVRKHYRNVNGEPAWESDMFAYLAACAEYGLQHQPVSLGICTNWDPEDAPDAPMIHYCQYIVGRQGEKIVGKATYRPWERVETMIEPACDYGRDFVAILNEFVDSGATSPISAAGAPQQLTSLPQSLLADAEVRRDAIVRHLYAWSNGKVQSGPFAGMQILSDVVGDKSSKLLGCYEAELHAAVEMAVGRRPDRIVNVGCAEGYYGIGLARLLPDTAVTCIDTDRDAIERCRRMAEINGLAGKRLETLDRCTFDDLERLIGKSGRTLIVMDCEGAEIELLDPGRVPSLRTADVIVECHEFNKSDVVSLFEKRFGSSHDLQIITESGRDPNSFEALRSLHSLDRWIAVNENRPRTMRWLVCWARNWMLPHQATQIVDFGHGRKRAVKYRPGSSDDDVIAVMRGGQYHLDRIRRWPIIERYVADEMRAGKQPLVVDAGANIGTSAIWFTYNVPACHVVSIEPSIDSFNLLAENVSGLSVTPRLGAVSAARGWARLIDPGIGFAALRTKLIEGNDDTGVERITIADIYAGCSERCFPFIVKVDIEGSEGDLFSQNTGWIKSTPLIIIELHDWMLPGSANSRNFLRAMSEHDRDFIYIGEHIYSISNDLIGR